MQYASIENISKSFGIRRLFKDISFYVEEGDKTAIIARNGSGKSTLLNIIAGKDTPDSGTVKIHKDIRVVMLNQNTNYMDDTSIWDHILSMNHPTAKLIKDYERFLEMPSRRD